MAVHWRAVYLLAIVSVVGCGVTKVDNRNKVDCPAPFSNCNDDCVNLATDVAHCNECGKRCEGEMVCSVAVCSDECAPGLTDCERSCVDVETDTRHCGACGVKCEAKQVCVGGACRTPSADCKTPKPEVCDGDDNDCDNAVDEGCNCVDTREQDCGSSLGICRGGVQRCKEGKWGSCESRDADRPYVPATSETCDGEDNDCDGDTDEGCDCVDGTSLECGTTTGLCQTGTQTCLNGRWGNCEEDVGPEQEECDRNDNDCDGDIDEGCDCQDGAEQACGSTLGECEPGVQRCGDGRWGVCEDASVARPHVAPQQEVCDGKDNDCDGDVDEGCDCEDSDEQECGSALGECQTGNQVCEAGEWSNCMGDVGPEPEDCDGLDNDCDGDIDEGCSCATGATRSCGSALGACELGTQYCQAGRWGDCVEDTGPEPEQCDAIDNDCDGEIDEGCECKPGTNRWCAAGLGPCRSGQQKCEGGSWGECISQTAPIDERCDGLDNDCDGEVDNGFDLDVPCPVGGCPQVRRCGPDQSSSSCVEDPRLRSPERCDGVDNDCDGLVDRVTEDGAVRSICECKSRTLSVGRAINASIGDNVHLCAPTQCGGDRPRGLLVDGICWPSCLLPSSDPDGDGWGFENGSSCLSEGSPKGQTAPPCGGVPIGMAMTYCLDCRTDPLPFAMCQSVPQLDLRKFGRGESWLKVDYTYTSSAHARVPVNLWFHTGEGRRKRLPLVKIGDIPQRRQVLLRIDEACFTPSAAFGSGCPGQGDSCAHCGTSEVCGAIAECGDYDLTQTWVQIAAEYCEKGIPEMQAGTVTIHSLDLVEPNCGK